MQINYRRDFNHTYAVLQAEGEPDTGSYQIRMILTNTIPGLLKCHIGKIDDSSFLYYDITSRQSLESISDYGKMGKDILRGIFESLLELLDELAKYLLPPEGVLLLPELIYTDAEWKTFSFCYLPCRRADGKSLEEQMRDFMEYLLPKMDHQNPETVALGYDLYREISNSVFSMDRMRTILYQKSVCEKHKTEEEENTLQKDRISTKDPGREELYQSGLNNRDEKKNEKEKIIPDASAHSTVFQGEKKEMESWEKLRDGLEIAVCVMVFVGIISIWWLQLNWFWYLAVFGGVVLFVLWDILFSCRKRRQNTDARKQEDKKQQRRTYEIEKDRELVNSVEKDRDVVENISIKSSSEEFYESTERLGQGSDTNTSWLIPVDSSELPVIPIEKGSTLIGKLASASDIILPFRTISRLHAKVIGTEEGDFLMDLNSKNGTRVNGVELLGQSRKKLEEGDQISFAGKKYRYTRKNTENLS